jgi:hypothetical protein
LAGEFWFDHRSTSTQQDNKKINQTCQQQSAIYSTGCTHGGREGSKWADRLAETSKSWPLIRKKITRKTVKMCNNMDSELFVKWRWKIISSIPPFSMLELLLGISSLYRIRANVYNHTASSYSQLARLYTQNITRTRFKTTYLLSCVK